MTIFLLVILGMFCTYLYFKTVGCFALLELLNKEIEFLKTKLELPLDCSRLRKNAKSAVKDIW